LKELPSHGQPGDQRDFAQSWSRHSCCVTARRVAIPKPGAQTEVPGVIYDSGSTNEERLKGENWALDGEEGGENDERAPGHDSQDSGARRWTDVAT